MDNLLAKLNDKQREAATHTEGPLLVLAGAGSGKTQMMTHRIAYLINEKGVPPSAILAVTFTNKAAQEMQKRALALVDSDAGLWVSTFHSFCARVLRGNAELIGRTGEFAIYDGNDQRAAIKFVSKSLGINVKEFKPKTLLSIIADAKEAGVRGADAMDKWLAKRYINQQRSLVYADVFAAYQKELAKNNALDFTDLLLETVYLFKTHSEALGYYQNRFRYIMVDEYQDTNFLQYELVRLLSLKSGNLCVVGDDDQCIYEWRGANIDNILGFEKDFAGAKVVRLEQNYRSTSNILDAANSVIVKNVSRKKKKLWTESDSGEKIEIATVADGRDEALFIIKKILTFVESGYRYSDMAILYRTNAQSRVFEEKFIASGLSDKYILFKGIRYYEREEIKDIIAYLRLIVNPRDDVSFERIINKPRRGLGSVAVEKLRDAAGGRGMLKAVREDGAEAFGLADKAVEGLREFAELYGRKEEEGREGLLPVYEDMLERSGYLRMLEKANTVEALSKIENLMEFKSAISDRMDGNPEITLADFLEEIALVSDQDDYDPNRDAVSLMTLHSAKGLEFPVVFLPGLEENLFPNVRLDDLPTKVEEERRLFYVGMTRAKERLFITTARERNKYGSQSHCKPSRFLKEINSKFIEETETSGLEQNSYRHKRAKKRFFDSELDGFGDPDDFGGFGGGEFSDMNTLKSGFFLKENKTPNPKEIFAAGDIIEHKKFGRGMIIDSDEDEDAVVFDHFGKKILGKGYLIRANF